METPKQFLVRQARGPKTALAGTPLASAGDAIANALANAASGLPDGPALPGLGALPRPAFPAGGLDKGKAAELFRSIEVNLPEGAPRLASVIAQVADKAPGGGFAQRGEIVGEAGERQVSVATRGSL